MKHLNHLIQKYLIYASPVVLATMLWGTFQSDTEIRQTGIFALKALWEVMSWTLMLWFALLFIFMILLALRKETQESTIKYLAGIHERDEREEVIMGTAARRSFTATAGLLILLLFLSCVTLTIAKLPANQIIDRAKSTLTIGIHFTEPANEKTASTDGSILYEHHDLPLSKTSLILLILIWQIAAFRIKARKELGVTSS